MNAITNKYMIWLMSQTRLMRYFIIAVMFHVALLALLGSIKIVAIVPSLVAKFTGATLPPPSNDLPDDPYAAYRDFDYNAPSLGDGGGLGKEKGPGGDPNAGAKAGILTADNKGEASAVGEVISVFSESATAITRPAGAPGSVGMAMAGMGEGMGGAGIKGPGGPWLGAGRMGPKRSVNLRAHGGSAETEKAVLAGLRWLKNHQEKNGSWNMGKQYEAGTAFAILAFCGHGETPDSAEFGPTISRAFQYMVSQVKPSGDVNGNMYVQGLTGLALSEAYVMTSSPSLREPLEKVIKFIIKAQAFPKKNPMHKGGWRYTANADSADTSVTGWQIMALKSAKSAGIDIDKKVFHDAADYVWNMYSPAGGFGYDGPGVSPALTPVGVLCQQFLGNGSDKRLRLALDHIDKYRMEWETGKGWCNLYGWYYATQATFQGGRSHWTTWNVQMRNTLLRSQKEDGRWELSETSEKGYGPVYATTLCTLMLEVYYRYLPMYQLTDTSVASEGSSSLPKTGPLPTMSGN